MSTTIEQISPSLGTKILAPPFALVDQILRIQVVGLEPFQTVTVRAVMQPKGHHWWESHAAFNAEAQGIVDLSTQKPVSGTYEQPDPMGLFWSMSLKSPKDMESIPATSPPLPKGTVRILAEVDDRALAWTDIARTGRSPDVTATRVRDNGLAGVFFRPAGPGPFPTVLVVGGSGGGISNAVSLSALLASRGFAALALAYFRYEHLPKDLYNIPLEYFHKAIEWLRSNPEVRCGPLGVVGRSRGGELALILAATFSEIQCVVAYVPGDRVYPGIGYSWAQMVSPDDPIALNYSTIPETGLMTRMQRPAWRYRGQFLPYTIIPVERIQGPALLISGKEDRVWPSARMCDHIMKRLEEYKHPYPDKHLSYAHAGHFISFPYVPTSIAELPHPTGVTVHLGGTAAGDAFANADSWPQVLQFLDNNLRAQV